MDPNTYVGYSRFKYVCRVNFHMNVHTVCSVVVISLYSVLNCVLFSLVLPLNCLFMQKLADWAVCENRFDFLCTISQAAKATVC